MTAFKLRESLAAALEQDMLELDHREEVRSPLLFGHICCGRLEKPDALRLTRVREGGPRSNFLRRLSGRVSKHLAGEQRIHERAFRGHIRRFGRESVLLEWFSDWIYYSRKKRRAVQDLDVLSIFWGQGSDGMLKVDWSRKGSLMIWMNRELLLTLVPPDATRSYLDFLYAETRGRNVEAELRLASGRIEAAAVMASEQLRSDKEAWKQTERLLALANRSTTTRPGKEAHALSLLMSLQTGLMLLRAAQNFQDVYLAGMSSAIVLGHFGDAGDRVPLGLISAMVEEPAAVKRIRETIEAQLLGGNLRRELGRLEAASSSICDVGKLGSVIGDDWNGDEICRHLQGLGRPSKEDVTSPVSLSPIPAWPVAIGLWLAGIVENLRNAVHEGNTLSFTFLVADESVLQDSQAFDVIPLRECGLDTEFESLESPFRDPASLKERLSRAVAEIRDNNYAWFGEGRYALLWDSTLPAKHPSALVAIRGSSWEVFISSCRRKTAPAYAKEAGMVFYVKRDGSGGILVQGEPGRSLGFRKGQRGWIGGWSESEKKLRMCLGRAGVGDDRTLDKLVSVCVAVSADTSIGSILVIWEGQAPPLFETMGSLWRLAAGYRNIGQSIGDLEEQELISLMAMDGATCVWQTKGEWLIDFRRLLQAPFPRKTSPGGGGGASARPFLSKGVKIYLDGQGSRKWSGALASENREVKLVVAISQDGPIFIIGSHELLADYLPVRETPEGKGSRHIIRLEM